MGQAKSISIPLNPWAARYYTGLPIKLTPKGVVFLSFLIVSLLSACVTLAGGGASGGLGHGRVLCCFLTAHPPWLPPFVAWTANGLIADKPGNNGSVEMIPVYL